ncbi:MAG: recombinase family protein [Clostridiales bacterium]|jgi:DNA invertase Pin-like site-specific DNA recombinase|nr:recombinase family protein [Clostridiales bacterium]
MEQQGYKNYSNTNIDFANLTDFKDYNAALYLRFSKDDGQTCDSSSIETQKIMLTKYCKDNGYKIYDCYVDDGYTGLNFDRPEFQRLLRDIDNGKINLVITKDLSRLGRDYIQTGHYVEIYFADNNIRYIAVNDNVDTAKPDSSEFMPFKNIFNNMYSRDISKKAKSAKRQRAYNGMFINPQAPYGYKKHPENKNKLIVDGEAAEVVKEIFRLALEDNGRYMIAKILTEKNILIPSAYKTAQGIKGYGHFAKDKKADFNTTWKFGTVAQILFDRVYAGDMVNRKNEVLNYKTKKLVRMPKEKHIVVRDTHEAIVSREDFDRVHELILGRHRPQIHQTDNVFRGLLFCAACGRRMSLAHQSIKRGGRIIEKRPQYRCKTHYGQNPEACPRNNYIYYDDIYGQISDRVKKVIELLKNDDKAFGTAERKTAEHHNRIKAESEKSKIEKRLNVLLIAVRKLYEDYSTETLDEQNYRLLLAGYQTEQRTLNEKLNAIKGELEKTDDYETRLNKLKNLAIAYSDNASLTAEMLKAMIERIEISTERLDNGIEHKINIIYRFINSNI